MTDKEAKGLEKDVALSPLDIAKEAICKPDYIDTKNGERCKIVPSSINLEEGRCALMYFPEDKKPIIEQNIHFSYIEKNLRAKLRAKPPIREGYHDDGSSDDLLFFGLGFLLGAQ